MRFLFLHPLAVAFVWLAPCEAAQAAGSPAAGASSVTSDRPHPDAVLPMLVGRWRSVDDPRAGFEVRQGESGFEHAASYDGRAMTPEPIAVAPDCDGRTDLGGADFLAVGTEDRLCYAIVDLTADRLEMTLVGRGNALVYRREE